MLLTDDRFLTPREHILMFRSRLLCFRVSVALANGIQRRHLKRDLNEISNAVFAVAAVSGTATGVEHS